ncbi:MAG: hypothetical protein SAL07_22720 [Oscillatoria sp. PMC 1051.18]|nr:hypothetical protein [Oscillatoria sp. PMC 1050.18]MEC5032724.1 hypothetical protein [Oscillatoria sp. PMC 1051.18]
MTYVPDETYIPTSTRRAIETELKNRFDSYLAELDDYQLSILQKSEKDFRSFVADIFITIAAFFGYIVGQVVGFVEDIGRGIKRGWNDGFKAGRGR